MIGQVSERDYYSLRDECESNQSTLLDYSTSGPTLISVVRRPRQTGIVEYCDEHWPELGMPNGALENFWEKRSGYRTNSAIENPHNKAYEDSNLDKIYRNHIQYSDDAQKRVSEAVSRLLNGEDLCFVCFEESPEKCHRHLLVDTIQQKASSRKSCQFTFCAD